MRPAHSPALELAIAAYRTPSLYSRLRDRLLPEDLILLLRVAAGEAQATEQACSLSGESTAVVIEAAAMFIQQLLFYPGADSYRVLGVSETAADSRIREQYRWLVRWLHPDRNNDEWDAVYADRVTLAWNDLRTPERRRAFDARRVVHDSDSNGRTAAHSGPARTPGLGLATTRGADFAPPARKAKRLPAKVLSGIAGCAALAIAWFYYLAMADGGARYSGIEVSPAATANTVPADEVETVSTPVNTQALVQAMTTSLQVPVDSIPRDDVARVAVATPVEAIQATSPAPDMPTPTVVASSPAPRPMPEPVVTPIPKPVARAVAKTARMPVLPSPAPPVVDVAVSSPRKAETPVAFMAVPTPVAGARNVVLTAPPPPAVPAAPELINEKSASDLILQFRSAYSSGNINQVQSLLARDGATRPSDRETILTDYRKLFGTSISRHIEIHDANWLTDGDTAILIGNFVAWVRRRGDAEERRVSGDIRFDLRNEDGELRIVRLRHDVKGG